MKNENFQFIKEKVLALLKAEGISITDKEAAIKSLSQTVMPTINIKAYRELLSDTSQPTGA